MASPAHHAPCGGYDHVAMHGEALTLGGSPRLRYAEFIGPVGAIDCDSTEEQPRCVHQAASIAIVYAADMDPAGQRQRQQRHPHSAQTRSNSDTPRDSTPQGKPARALTTQEALIQHLLHHLTTTSRSESRSSPPGNTAATTPPDTTAPRTDEPHLVGGRPPCVPAAPPHNSVAASQQPESPGSRQAGSVTAAAAAAAAAAGGRHSAAELLHRDPLAAVLSWLHPGPSYAVPPVPPSLRLGLRQQPPDHVEQLQQQQDHQLPQQQQQQQRQWQEACLLRGSHTDSNTAEVDAGRVAGICHFNSFKPDPLLPNDVPDALQHRAGVILASAGLSSNSPSPSSAPPASHCPTDATGMWELPSYINHACIGNVTRYFIGDFMFVRAVEDLPRGKQLSYSYIIETEPLEERRDALRPHGFQCACEMCEEEGAAEADPKRRFMAAQLREQWEKLRGNITRLSSSPQHLPNYTRQLTNLLAQMRKAAAGRSWALGLSAPLCSLAHLHQTAGNHAAAARAYDEAYHALCRHQDPNEIVSTPSAITVALNCATMHCLGGDSKEAAGWIGVARSRWVVMYGCGDWFDTHFQRWLQALAP
ncbi:MAG: hypothetical protein WDW38_003703 [Sanguina aurantia]